jgi:hypothetical protein
MKIAYYMLIAALFVFGAGCDENNESRDQEVGYESSSYSPGSDDQIWFTDDAWTLERDGQDSFLINGITANFNARAELVLEFSDANGRVWHTDRLPVWLAEGKVVRVKYRFDEPAGDYYMQATVDPDSIVR